MKSPRMLVVALSLVGATASPQAPARSTFYVVVGADTILVERVTREPRRLAFQMYSTANHSRLDFEGSVTSAALIDRATISAFASDRDTVAIQKFSVQFAGDSAGVERAGTTSWVHVGSGALPYLNPSPSLMEQALMRARALGGDSATFNWLSLPAGPGFPVTVTWKGADSATMRFGAALVRAAVSPSGQLLGGVIPMQGVKIIRAAGDAAAPQRKTYPAPAGAPYTAQDVAIHTRSGLTLNGTLTVPLASRGRVPAIVLISGSGPEDRDGAPPTLPKWRPFYQIADSLGRRGIAVLRVDDRGLGSDAGPATATTLDFAEDVRDEVAFLRSRPEIDPRRIGLIGHSEGGSIAPMVAASDSSIAAVVIMAGTVSKGRDVIQFQQRFVIDSMAHLMGQQRDAALAQYARNTDSVAATLPWMKFFLDYDGRPAAAKVRAPVLILHGEKDYQVPVSEAEKTSAAIRGGGNRDVTVRLFPATNHLFLGDAGVGFSYEKLPSFTVSPVVLGTIADWLVARLKP